MMPDLEKRLAHLRTKLDELRDEYENTEYFVDGIDRVRTEIRAILEKMQCQNV